MGFSGFEQSDFVLDLRRYVREYATAEGRAMQYEVAEVEVYVYRAYGDGGPRSHRPDITRISHDDRTYGDGWGVNVQHHNETTAAALGRHVMFCSDAHLAEGRDVELYATAQAICAFVSGRITHSPKRLFPDSRSVEPTDLDVSILWTHTPARAAVVALAHLVSESGGQRWTGTKRPAYAR